MTMTAEHVIDAPREDLIRMSSSALRATEDGSTLFGYAAVFNSPTTINSWEGEFVEVLAPGCFRKTLKERGDRVKVLFNHGMDPSIGDKPLGKPTVQEEDATGLRVECPLDDTSYNADIRALLRSGALDGMSFRMTIIGEKWDHPKSGEHRLPTRTITEVKLHEWGPVTFPAYEATQAGVRAHAPAAFEAWRSANAVPPTTTVGAALVHAGLTVADAVRVVERHPPAGDVATEEQDQQDENGPDDQATRSEQSTPYQPASPPPLSFERRQSQVSTVQGWAARSARSA